MKFHVDAQLPKRFAIGEAAKAQQLELQLMSNNTKGRITISVMTLVTRIIERSELLRDVSDGWLAMPRWRYCVGWSGRIDLNAAA